MKVFVSYAREDKKRVERYVDLLRAQPDLAVFWDEDMTTGSFTDILARECTGASAFLVFVSAASCQSEWVPKELHMAQNTNPGVKLLPIHLDLLDDRARQSGLMFALGTANAVMAHKVPFQQVSQRILTALRAPTGGPTFAPKCPIIAVMGRQGGVGKSTFITATADLIAMTGANVLIVDTDTNTAGIAGYLALRTNRRPRVWTVLDAAYAKAGKNIVSNRDLGMWEVTPSFLHEKRFGRVFLIPGRHETDSRPGFEAVAGLENRNRAAMEILNETIQRGTPEPLSAILIDSPADDTPLVSAGFALASYGYVVCRPTIELARDLSRLDSIHQQRYPDHNVPPMHLVVNMATARTEQLWQGMNASFIREDPAVRGNVDKGTLDFDLVGLTSFYEDVLAVHQKHFTSIDQNLLPDEKDVWVRPYIKLIAERHLPQQLMRSSWFRSHRIASILLPIVGAAMIAGCGYLGYHNINREQTSYKLAVIQVDSRDAAEAAKQRILKGEGFSKVAQEVSTDRKTAALGAVLDGVVLPASRVPGIGLIEGLQGALAKASPGAMCDQIFQAQGNFYLIRLVDKLASQTENALRHQLARFAGVLGTLLGFVLVAASPFVYVKWSRRKALLVDVSQKGTDKRYLDELFRKSKQTGALKWLKQVFGQAIEAEKWKLRV